MADPEVTIAGMLQQISSGRAELDSLFATSSPTSAGAWTLKDQMAHIATWERSALALLNGEGRMAHVGLERDAYRTLGEDGVNEHIRATFADGSEADVRAYYDEIHAALLARLKGMSDDDLQLPYSHYQPNDPPHNPRPVWHWLAGNTYKHYREHVAIMRATTA